MAYSGVGVLLLTGIFSAKDSSKSFTGGMVGHGVYYTRLNITSIKSTSFNVQCYNHNDNQNSYIDASVSYIAFK